MDAGIDTKQIDCPDHKGAKLHTATLYCYPHTLAGIWECNKQGTSGNHRHINYGIETAVSDHMGIDGHYQTETQVYACDDCGVELNDSQVAHADRAATR
jgi:hypothetical protein